MFYSRQPNRSVLAVLLCAGTYVHACEDDDDWAYFDAIEKAQQVNEGALVILEPSQEGTYHQHINTIRITEESLNDGWVELDQCHRDLDAVPALQIVFAEGRTRNIELTSHRNIGRAWLEGVSVQLEDITADSEICLRASTRALTVAGEGWQLNTGPYMRRFLDGFYPMRVKLGVEYPEGLIRPAQMSPETFERTSADSLELDIWFEGKLRTEVVFEKVVVQ